LLFGYGGMVLGTMALSGSAAGYLAIGGVPAGDYAMGGAAYGVRAREQCAGASPGTRFLERAPGLARGIDAGQRRIFRVAAMRAWASASVPMLMRK
jgi:hypothetical protein